MPSSKVTTPPQGTRPAAATVRANAAAATAAGGAGDAKCDFCDRVGLPILPLRYAVAPSYVPASIGNPVGWARLGAQLQGKPPEGLKGHRYVLRTLRKGYVMVYFGSGLWHAYTVTEGGHLRKLADIDDPDFLNDREMSAQCKQAGHNVPASFINIPPIAVGGTRMLPTKVWIAFSDVLWTRNVRKRYEGSAAGGARGQRMQEFSTDQLGKSADAVTDAFQLGTDKAASADRLTGLAWEYAKDDEQARQRTHYSAVDPYDPKKRNRVEWQSAHGLAMRTREAEATAERAAQYAADIAANPQKLMASAVVLHDPLGMVQELNATRLHQIESRQRYLSSEQIARPLLISQSIVGLKKFIGEQMSAQITADEEQKGLPDVQTETVYAPDDLPSQSQRLTYTTTRQERIEAQFKPLWQSLQAHYREGERAAFEKTVAATLADFQKWFVRCDADYAHWWGQRDWVLRRRDFDPDVADQQDRVIEAFAAANAGGPTNDPGNDTPQSRAEDIKTYEMWVKYLQMSPADEANPLYVAMFGDRKELLDYLLPDSPDLVHDKIDKGSKLYKAIKTLLAEDLSNDSLSVLKAGSVGEVLDRKPTNRVPNPIRAAGASAMNAARKSFIPKATGAAAHAMLAIGGALNRLAVNAVSEVYRATALRAVQGAVMLYERREIILVTTRIKVREYLAMLNDIGFGAANTALSSASRAIKSVAKQGTQTVRSMAVAGALFISDPKVKEAFIEVMGFAYDELDSVTQQMDAAAEGLADARTAHATQQAGDAAQNAIAKAAMQVHPFTLSPNAQRFVDTVVAKANTLRMGSATILKGFTRHALRISSTGTGLLAVGSFIVQGWSLKDNIAKADKAFIGNNEARVLVTAGAVATIGAVFEVGGAAGKLAGATWATRVGRIGGVIGGAASIIEGVQAGLAAMRTGRHGDNDARWLYSGTAVFLIGGGITGVVAAATGAALFGPLGIAMLLIAAGVALLYFAAKAEDTQAGIWLDRCYWGNGERFKNASNIADRPWTNNEVDDELKQLNAIVLGLKGEMGFNDDGWGFADWTWDTVKAKLTFPYFNAQYAAYEWRLRAIGHNGAPSKTLARGSHREVPEDPNAIVVRATAPRKQNTDHTEYFRNLVVSPPKAEGTDGTMRVIEVSVEVKVKHFQDVELTAEYVPDTLDPQGRASLSLSESD